MSGFLRRSLRSQLENATYWAFSHKVTLRQAQGDLRVTLKQDMEDLVQTDSRETK